MAPTKISELSPSLITFLSSETPLTDRFSASLPAPADTDHHGALLADALRCASAGILASGLALRLEGNLGAGKTSLIRAALRRLGWEGAVKSPTFTLLETYPCGEFTINHFDFYRFEEPEEFEDAGFQDEFRPGAVCATEWSEKAFPYLPPADITVALSIEGLGRRVEITAQSPLGREILASISESWNSTAAA